MFQRRECVPPSDKREGRIDLSDRSEATRLLRRRFEALTYECDGLRQNLLEARADLKTAAAVREQLEAHLRVDRVMPPNEPRQPPLSPNSPPHQSSAPIHENKAMTKTDEELVSIDTDERWGGYVPWFLRYLQAPGEGDFDKYFKRVGQRVERLLNYEVPLVNADHFGARLETESLQRFEHHAGYALGVQLRGFFNPQRIRESAEERCREDPEQRRLEALRIRPDLGSGFYGEDLKHAQEQAERTYPARLATHRRELAAERLGVLEVLLNEVHDLATSALAKFILDLRRFGAEAGISLDIQGDPPRIIPLNERLLQGAVVDPLLGRLQARWPERAQELIDAYHDVLAGRKLDEVFSNAYKSLEELARSVTANTKFDFSEKDLRRHFPHLHPTIHNTCVQLRAHRGDKAAHGRKAPSVSEIRYLLFQVCNIALLLTDQELPSE